MPHVWTEREIVFGEVGFATKMQLAAENDEIVKDVIQGDGTEGSGWNGHTHKAGSTWDYSSATMGALLVKASSSRRGAVYRKQFDHSILHGPGYSYDSGAFPAWVAASNDNTPSAFVRGDFSSNLGAGICVDSDFSIGHDNVTDPSGSYGYYFELKSGTGYWHVWVYNWERVSIYSTAFIGHMTSPDA